MKRQSNENISTIQRKLWELCKQIIRKRYKHTCYTCGAARLRKSNLQTGHMWAKGSLGAYMKYDLRILRPQCMRCNIWHGGMGAVFYAKMLSEEGPEYMAQLEKDKQVTVKAYDHYVKLTNEYTKILADLA